jgi:hypothetical protein
LLTKCAKLKIALLFNQNPPYISSKTKQALNLRPIKSEMLYSKGFQILLTNSSTAFKNSLLKVKPLSWGLTAFFLFEKEEK